MDPTTYRLRLRVSREVTNLFRTVPDCDKASTTSRASIPLGYLSYYLGDSGLIHKIRAAYPDTWVDRMTAIVLKGSPESQEHFRLAIIQRLLVATVTGTSYDPRWIIEDNCRNNVVLYTRIKALVEPANLQERVKAKLCWLIAYLLDCSERADYGAFSRSVRQIMEDSEGRYTDIKRVSAHLSLVVEGWSDTAVLPVFELVSKGDRSSGKASMFVLSNAYKSLHDGRLS